MSRPASPEPVWLRRWKAFREDRRGVAAVEFALIAMPFFVMTFGMIEIIMIFIMNITLDYGVQEAARRVRTGELQNAGENLASFKTTVCGELHDLMDCDGKLTIDVRTFDSFTATELETPIDDEGEFKDDGMTFQPGAANQIVIVRAFYQWPLITPVISAPLSNMSNGRRLLVATAAFRNEPF
jgi:Flp pilus assembly protein TadG